MTWATIAPAITQCLIALVAIIAAIIGGGWVLDRVPTAFGKRPHSPKPDSPRVGLSEGDGVTINHDGCSAT